ncbi:MAG TPA: STAS domain-containing protein [Spirochaetota bacterium]|nr:STAS domain-containing protein [Spirochaetota bacterium]HOM38757.1 STAS domain-containing protein [Spirochaetota bacterium]HPQ49555.1 STAS domain-containing protein [Spirochaetota bacterium]
MELKIDFIKDNNIVIAKVEGILDAHYAPQFEKKLSDYVKQINNNLIIDLSGVSHIASAGFGALMPIKNIQDSKGKKIVLSGLNDNVKKIFNLLGFSNVIKEYKNIEEAKSSL